MKKLNSKGFTLIELLAVVVVLAIVLVVTIPSVINSMRNAKLSQLHNLSMSVAQWYDKATESDDLGFDDNILGNIPEILADSEWHCLKDAINTANNESLVSIYGLNENDINIGGDVPDASNNDHFYEPGEDDTVLAGMADFEVTSNICSGIRVKNGKAEVYLVAKDDGKFDVGWGETAYAVSYGENGFTGLS